MYVIKCPNGELKEKNIDLWKNMTKFLIIKILNIWVKGHNKINLMKLLMI